MYETLDEADDALLCTTSAGPPATTLGVAGVVTTCEGTFAMKSNGLPERLPLSDHWHESEQLDDGAQDPGGALASVTRVCLVEGGIGR